jgi:hypothetical protein
MVRRSAQAIPPPWFIAFRLTCLSGSSGGCRASLPLKGARAIILALRELLSAIAKPRSLIPILHRRGDLFVAGLHHRLATIWAGAAWVSRSANSYSRLVRWVCFPGAGPAGLRGVFYPSLPQIRKSSANSNARARVAWPIPTTARSASLRCHRSRDTRPDRPRQL